MNKKFKIFACLWIFFFGYHVLSGPIGFTVQETFFFSGILSFVEALVVYGTGWLIVRALK